MVDDPARGGNPTGKRLKDRVDRRVVSSDRCSRSTPTIASAEAANALALWASSAFADAGERFHTCTVCPCASSRRTKPLPINPVPRTAIFMGSLSALTSRAFVLPIPTVKDSRERKVLIERRPVEAER